MTETLDNRRFHALLCGIALSAATPAIAENEAETDEVPEMAFLEYLGMWEESDEDWLLLAAQEVAENDKRSDPVPEGEESMEVEDES